MENCVQYFNSSEFGQIRTVYVNGQIHFIASDVAKALGYSNARDAVQRHCRWVVKHDVPHPQSKTKTLQINVIPEGDIYRLVVNSTLPSAKKFERWVFDEVLPTIRSSGSFEMNYGECKKQSTKPQQQSLPACLEDLIIQQATLLKELRIKVESQQQQIDKLEHKPFSQFNTYRSCEDWLFVQNIPYQKPFFWAFSRKCAKYSRENNIPVHQTGKKGYVVNAYREDVLERCFGNKLALPEPKQGKNIVYQIAEVFNAMSAEMRLVVIKNWGEWKETVPAMFRDAIWKALTTDISKIPRFDEPKKIRRAG